MPIRATPLPTRAELTYAQMFQEIARRYDLDWRMLAAQAYVESKFDTMALGRDGDLGLMQVLPRTWQEWAPAVDVDNPFDAYSNTLVAATYLDYLRNQLGQQGYPETRWMLVAYNWGPDKLSRFLADGNSWDNLPPSLQSYANEILRITESLPQ
jgi:soluble lytic murein transglycosylase-like protein